MKTQSKVSSMFCMVHADDVALTTNQNFVRDFPVAYDILFENISDQVSTSCAQFLGSLHTG